MSTRLRVMASQETPSKSKKISVRLADPPSREEGGEQALTVSALVASFPHGLPREVESLDIKARASEGRGGVKRPRASLEAETEHMRYSCNQPLANKKALAKYLVGVYDKARGEVVLHPVESVLQISQHIKAVEEAEKAAKAKKAREQDEAKQGNYEKRKSLVESFGSKKKQRAMQSREDNRIHADGVVGVDALGSFLAANMQSAVKDAEEAGDAFSAAEASRSALLPRFHRSAKSVERVYRLRELVSEDEWGVVEEEADWVLQAQGEKEDGDVEATLKQLAEHYQVWPSCVNAATRDALLLPGLSPTDRRERLCGVVYLRHLFAFQQAPPVLHGEAAAVADTVGLPEAVALRLLSTFAETSTGHGDQVKHVRTKGMNDKLLLHLLVLYLIVGGFKVSATRIAQDLRMGVKDVSLLLRETGCSTAKRFRGGGDTSGAKQAQDEVIAELTVPLRFPQPGKRVGSRH